MKLITQRLILKEYEPEDLNNFYNLKSCASVWEYSSFVPLEHLNQAENLLNSLLVDKKSNKKTLGALFRRDTQEYIGEAGIINHNLNANRCEVGYNLLPSFWKEGYATEIVNELISYSFQTLNVERMEALVLEGNIGSRKVLEKNGFCLEGILRNFNKHKSGYRNVCYYGLISSDLKSSIY